MMCPLLGMYSALLQDARHMRFMKHQQASCFVLQIQDKPGELSLYTEQCQGCLGATHKTYTLLDRNNVRN